MFDLLGTNGRGLFFLAPDTGANAAGGVANAGDSGTVSRGTEGEKGGQPSNAEQTASSGAQKPSWISQLKEDLRGNEDLGGFKTISDLANAFLDLKKSGGNKKGVSEEGKGAEQPKAGSVLENVIGDSDWNGFDAGLSKDSDPFGNIAGDFVKACKDKGVSPSVAKELLQSVEKGSNANRENHAKTSGEACIKTLKETWGDNYEGNIALMKQGYDKIFHDNVKALSSFVKAGLGNHPLVCELFRAVGAIFKEPTPATNTSGNVLGDKDTSYKDFLASL